MTLEQLAALPAGTRVRLWIDRCEKIDDYDYGVVSQSGSITIIKWKVDWKEDELYQTIDTKSKSWEQFVIDIDEDPQ